MNHTLKSTGQTPLHLAVSNGRVKVVKSLVKAGAHINAVDKKLNTPLHFVNNSPEDGRSTFPFASTAHGFHSIAELLIQNGANVHAKNADGKTPLDMFTNHKS